tara:strand:- start:1950 stop:2219 length:270 start_codon:yes stop_codon:yes gene_type:complete
MNQLPDEVLHNILNEAAMFYANERLKRAFNAIHVELILIAKLCKINNSYLDIEKWELSEQMLFMINTYSYFIQKRIDDFGETVEDLREL